jgi:AraC family transcriptional regulator of adaptative response / DNA-3-methyladenine glycosylase II
LRLIGEGALDEAGVEQLASRLGVTSRHLRRLFIQHLGAAPLDVALTRRVHFAKKLLDETTLPVQQIAFASGFRSLRRFNSQIRRTYTRTPSELRRLAGRRAAGDPGCYRFQLAYRPPYDWDAVLGFLQGRATPGVEVVAESCYRRTIEIDGRTGVIEVSHPEPGGVLVLLVRFPDPRALLGIVERVRRQFDLGADPGRIGGHLRSDLLLRPALDRHPGIRTPGAWDGFEVAVRAILGQQVSVRAATTIAGRIAAAVGTPVTPDHGLDRLFPSPGQLANAPLEHAGVMPARAATIRALARAVADGRIGFGSSADAEATLPALRAIGGIGDWTAQYIAMRAFGEPDAFPSADLILRRAAGVPTARALDRRSAVWRPWRAYAVVLLWQAANDEARRSRHATRDRDVPVGRA